MALVKGLRKGFHFLETGASCNPPTFKKQEMFLIEDALCKWDLHKQKVGRSSLGQGLAYLGFGRRQARFAS